MQTKLKKLLFLMVVAGLTYGASSAHGHKPSSSQPLQPLFEQINQTYFGGALKNVDVQWADLKSEEARGVTRFYDHGSFLIELDRTTNAKSRDIQTALNHEACHVATHLHIEHESSDVHGPAFQDCMRRFSNKKVTTNSSLSVVLRPTVDRHSDDHDTRDPKASR